MKNSLAIILVAILGIGCGFGAYYIINDMKGDIPKQEETNNQTEQEGDGLNQTELVKSLHKSLITNDNFFGFYFKDKTTIETISDDAMMLYVLSNMVKEKNINDMLYNDDFVTFNPNAKVATQSEINDYVKKQFNTNREFKLKISQLESIGLVLNGVTVCILSDGYYCGEVGMSGERIGTYSELEKYEISKDNKYIYIYDKAIIYNEGVGDGISLYATNYSVVENYYSSENQINLPGTENYDPNKTIEQYFNKYESKLNTFKHTFKKASDGKYYWYSSEIVSE